MPQPSRATHNSNNGDYLRALLTTARQRPGLWIIPLLSALLIALLMAYLGPKTWDASQSIVVREELIGRIVGPGRFDSLDTMKTAQETIQEASRNPVVLRRAMRFVEEKADDWQPSRQAIQDLQGAITFSAPGGGELGKTEILTMTVKSSSPDKAIRLVESIITETMSELRNIRQRRAESMLLESRESVSLAAERLKETSEAIQQIEASVGGDLNELRGLTQPYSSGGTLKSRIAQIETEKRAADLQAQRAHQLKKYLQEVQSDPDELVATPRELLDSQPSLLQLKIRLIEAQVAYANVSGTFSKRHPRVQASRNALNDIQNQIRFELDSSLVGLGSQAELADRQVAMMSESIEQLQARAKMVASLRVDYSRLTSEMAIRTEALSKAHGDYAQVESIQRAANNVDFATPFDEAESSLQPLGPTKKTLVVAAALAGALIGLGLVMMVTPAPTLFPPRQDRGLSSPSTTPQTPSTQPTMTAAPAVPKKAQTAKAANTGTPISQVVSGQSIPTPPPISQSGGFVIPDISPGTDSIPNQPQ